VKSPQMPMDIRACREALGWTQRRAAALTGIHPVRWCRIESGRFPARSYELERLVRIFDAQCLLSGIRDREV